MAREREFQIGMTRKQPWLACVLLFLSTGALLAQANTGKITGRVTSGSDGLPGVLVTATSPALQGERTVMTRATGDYLLPQLPAGDYRLTFSLEGFSTLVQEVKVNVDQTTTIDQAMSLSDVTEEIVVTAEAATISTDTQSQTTYELSTIENLAITRSIEDTAVLAPGVHQTGPQADSSLNGAAISISGSQTYENLFLVNGVVVNENTRGQAIEFVIEDAIQETTISTSGVSAEFGRFNGGVVNVITKSGGNEFHGSFRDSLSKEAWEGRTPLSPADQDNTTNETYEATLGGRILRDKLWFFLAGRDLERSETETLDQTLIPLSTGLERDRAEVKLTVSPTNSHRVIGAYSERNSSEFNDHFSAIDLSTVNPVREDPEDLTSVNYTGVLTPNFFVEAQYSERTLINGKGVGAQTTERIGGTWIVDLPNFVFLASPVFCAVCVDNERNNENTLIKASWFLATENAGTHDIVVGFDTFDDINVIENHQSASDFQVWTFEPSIIRGSQAFPQITNNGANRLRWDPVLEATRGMKFQTDSFYVNDTWSVGDRWRFNLGLRYDDNESSNGSGEIISDDTKLAPRLGASFDVKGDGDWVVNATYAEYASSINTGANIGGTTGSAGALGNWTWLYNGPDINPDPNAPTDQLLTADEALEVIFAWFDSIGGIDNVSQRINLTIPGLGLQVPRSITTPSAEEFTVGVIKRLGTKGLVRADVVRREFSDFYSERVDQQTGQVQNPDGSFSDLTLFENTNARERIYDGLHTQFSYRFNRRVQVAGNWTWSHARGDFDGETEGQGALPSELASYPEIKAFDRHTNRGPLLLDQRHKVSLWAIYTPVITDRHNLSISLLQRYGSGRPFVGTELTGPGQVAARNFVDLNALGYLESDPTVDYWYFGRGEFRTDDITSTDLAINYSFTMALGNRKVELFLQPEVLNVFNEDGAFFVDATVLDATSSSQFQSFNPFTTTPVEGVHFGKGPNFGQPTSAEDFQTPRTFRFSVGVRF